MKNAKDKNVHVIMDSERHKKRRKKDGVYVTVINIKLLLCKDNAAYSRVPRFIRHFNGLISAIMQRQNYCRDMKWAWRVDGPFYGKKRVWHTIPAMCTYMKPVISALYVLHLVLCRGFFSLYIVHLKKIQHTHIQTSNENKWRAENRDPFHFSMQYDLLNCIYSSGSHPFPSEPSLNSVNIPVVLFIAIVLDLFYFIFFSSLVLKSKDYI